MLEIVQKMEKVRPRVSNSSFKWRSTFLHSFVKMSHLASQATVVLSTSQIQNWLFFKRHHFYNAWQVRESDIPHLFPSLFFPLAFTPWWIRWDSPSNWWHHLILFPDFSSKGDTQVISSFHLPLLQLTLGAYTHSNNLQRQFHNLHLGNMFCCCYLPSKIW